MAGPATRPDLRESDLPSIERNRLFTVTSQTARAPEE
jgi:hypothetical protein